MIHINARLCAKAHTARMERIIPILAALAEPTRLGALSRLWSGEERCVCELMEELGATQSRMSRHMAVLKAAGLVVDRRDAQWVRYRRNPGFDPAIAAAIDRIMELAAGSSARPKSRARQSRPTFRREKRSSATWT
jgi:ArsR family transcriptional regulator